MTKHYLILISVCILLGSTSFAESPDGNVNIMIPSAKAAGQEGNGGFVFKDKERTAKADGIINASRDEMDPAVSKADPNVFSKLRPAVDKDEFLDIVRNTVVMPLLTAYRPLPNGGGEILMMDYRTGSNGAKFIVVYAPMFVALMYMEDQVEAKKFFETQWIHEILHHFSYNEAQADETAPQLYEALIH